MFDRLADLPSRQRRAVEVEIQGNLHVRSGARLERADVLRHVAQHRRRRVAVDVLDILLQTKRASRIARKENVRLQRMKALGPHLFAQRRDVIHGPHGRRPDHPIVAVVPLDPLEVARPRAAAMRPIDQLPLPSRPAKQRVHRHAQRLPLDVPQRQLDPRNRLGHDPTRRLPSHPIHVPVASLNRQRITPDQHRLQISNRPHDPIGSPPVRNLPIPRDPIRRTDSNKLPRPPTRINNKRLNLSDLHGVLQPCRCVSAG